MDLVFTRYSSPFFLDYCIQNAQLNEFVDNLIAKTNEQKLWEMYLATIPHNDKSFEDWKNDVTKGSSTNASKAMSKQQIDATIKRSEQILRGFKPPQERR